MADVAVLWSTMQHAANMHVAMKYSFSLQLSQIEPEVMTPVERYIIFYGLSRNSLQNISTADNTTTNRIITDIRQGGNYSVGVAAMNSGGISIITYSQTIGMKFYACSAADIGWSVF